MEDFYIYLSSLANSVEYPLNTVGKFTNVVRPSCNLTGSWSVGLANIIFSNELLNIDKNRSDLFSIKYSIRRLTHISNLPGAKESDIKYETSEVLKEYLPSTNIDADNISDLILILEGDMRAYLYKEGIITRQDYALFHYSSSINRIIFSNIFRVFPNPHHILEIEIYPSLAMRTILGTTSSVKLHAKTFTCPFPPKMYNKVDCVYIYSDIVSRTRMGGGETNILDILPLKGNYSKDSTSIIYKPLKHNTIESISIDLRNQNGEDIHFKNGKSTICVLHFKQL